MTIEKIFMGFIFFLFISLFVIVIYGILVLDPSLEKAQEKACEKIGFEKYVQRQEMDFCEDKIGNLYYINIDCGREYEIMLPVKKCIAKQIKVGEVWGTSG